MYDFILVLIFYNHVLSMHNFWDKLFYDNVCLELEATNEKENECKYQDLVFEYRYAHAQQKHNERYNIVYNWLYILVNVGVFTAQVLYIESNTIGSRVTIMVLGTVLLIMDTLMIHKFYVTIDRFILLLTDDEHTWKRWFLKL